MLLLVQTSTPLKRPFEKTPCLSHTESPIRVLSQPAHERGDSNVRMEEENADDESQKMRVIVFHSITIPQSICFSDHFDLYFFKTFIHHVYIIKL